MEDQLQYCTLDIVPHNEGYLVRANVPLLSKFKDGFWFIKCPLLKTLAYSEISEADAILKHDESINAFIQTHQSNGTLELALRHLGWRTLDKTAFQAVPNIPAGLLDQVKRETRETCYA